MYVTKPIAFRRVRSDDDITLAEQQVKETTAAVLVEILQDQNKRQSANRQQHHPHAPAPFSCDARPRSLGAEVDVVASFGVQQSGFAGGRQRESECSPSAIEAQVTVSPRQEVTESAKVIASRLQKLGDAYQSKISEDTLRQMTAIIASPNSRPEDSDHLRDILVNLTASLSLQKVFQLFVLLHHLISDLATVFGNRPPTLATTTRDRRWDLFQELMEQTIHRVTRWICLNGGWTALLSTIRSRGNSFVDSPPPSPSILTKTRSRVFSLSEDGELTPETQSACELLSSSPLTQGNATASPLVHDPQEEWCNIEKGGVAVGSSDSQLLPSASKAIPVPSKQCEASRDSPFDRFRSGSLPANRREKRGLSRASQIALTAYSTVVCYLGD